MSMSMLVKRERTGTCDEEEESSWDGREGGGCGRVAEEKT